MKLVVAAACLHIFTLVASGQTAGVCARVISAESRHPLPGALLTLISRPDPSVVLRSIADSTGAAFFPPVPAGLYLLEVHHVGHFPHSELLECGGRMTDAGPIALRTRTIRIEEVVIRAEPEIQMKGDTTEYLADAFRMSAEASVGDLLDRLPGITFSGGTIRAGMSEVAEILIDGSPIPTGDRRSMMQAIPAGSIERVQLYDRQGEEAEFSGFDDGSRRTTINLVSKGKRLDMTTVNASGAYGESGRYEARGAYLRVAGPRRYAIIGNYVSGSGTGSNLITPGIYDEDPRTGTMDAGLNPPSSQRITRGMGSAGFNEQGEDIYASIGYVINRPGSENDERRQRRYVLPGDAGSLYNEHRTSTSVEYTHTINGRLELAFGEYSSAVFTPRLTFRSGESERWFSGERILPAPASPTLVTTMNRASVSSDMLGGTFVLRQKFDLPGRTLSLELGLTRQNGERHTYTETRTANNGLAGSVFNTRIEAGADNMPSREYKTRILFTEPLTVISRIQFEYLLTGSRMGSSLRTSLGRPSQAESDSLDPSASSSFEQRVTTHRGGSAFQIRIGEVLMTAGIAYERTELGGEETWSSRTSSSHTYGTFLPSASLKVGKGLGILRMRYGASAIIPTLGQTQEVVDNAHPMFMTIGNADLRQGVQHSLSVQYVPLMDQGVRFWVNALGAMSSGGICRSVTVFEADTILPNGAIFPPGGELASYANESGAWNTRASIECAFPVSAIGSELSVWTSGSMSFAPWFRNGIREETRQWSVSPEFSLRTFVDTTLRLSGTCAYTFRSTIASARGSEPHGSRTMALLLEATWWAKRWLSFESTLVMRNESDVSTGNDERGSRLDLTCIIAPFGPRRLVIRLEAHDLLNTDRNVVRTFTESYVEDMTGVLLPRYFLVRMSYFWN